MLHSITLKSVPDPYFQKGTIFGETPGQENARMEAARVDYKNLLMTIVQRGNGQGFSLDDVEKGTTILRALRKVETGQVLTLEDADYNYLLAQVRAFRYGVIDERIVDFKNDLESAPVVDPNDQPEPPVVPAVKPTPEA